MPGAGHFETLHGDVDPAARSEAADRCATLLVRGAHDTDDETVVERVGSLADSEGLETLADLWASSPPDSLAGCLWRLYLLRAWVYADPVAAAREFDAGRHHTPVYEAVAGVDGIHGAVAPDSRQWRRDGTALIEAVPIPDSGTSEGEATLDGVEANLDFMEEMADRPFNFCRAEVYAGTPLRHALEAEGRL